MLLYPPFCEYVFLLDLDPLDLLSVVEVLDELLSVLLSPVVSLVPSVVWLPLVVWLPVVC